MLPAGNELFGDSEQFAPLLTLHVTSVQLAEWRLRNQPQDAQNQLEAATMTRPTIEEIRRLVTEKMPHAFIQIAVPLSDDDGQGGITSVTPLPVCSPDFASVNWYGTVYGFTPTQRRIVAVLWNAYQNGTPDVSERTILEEADSDSANLRMLFRGHPALGRMIQRSSQHGGPPGCFRLVRE